MGIITTAAKAAYDAVAAAKSSYDALLAAFPSHASQHKSGGSDAIKLNELAAPTASVGMNAQKITGMASGVASGEGVHAGQTATQSAAGLITAANQLKLDSNITAWGATTIALPAYTYANGASGVGATITANANGAFPTLDGNVSLTANDPVQGVFLLHNGSSAAHNGVYLLTQQGDAGTPWIATRHTGADTATKIRQSRVTVLQGQQGAGGIYIYDAIATLTVGTTAMFYWRLNENEASPNEMTIACNTDFLAVSANNNATAATNEFGLTVTNSGSGAGPTYLARASNTATRQGVYQQSTGTTAAGACITNHSGAVVLGANVGFRLKWKGGLPTLSDGTNTFGCVIGLSDGGGNITPSNGVMMSFQTLISTTDWQFSCSNGGTVTNTGSARTIAAGTDDRADLRKDAGDTNIYMSINGGAWVTLSSNIPTTNPVSLTLTITKSAGIAPRVLESDYLRCVYYSPTRRAA